MSILNTTADILMLISQLKRGITAADVITHLQLPKSTTSRVLKQLCDTGFLQRDTRTSSYQPGLMILEMAWVAHQTSSLTDDVEYALHTLCQSTGHTGYLSVLDGGDVLVLRVVPGRHALRVITHPGSRSSAWQTSTGRALLARFSDEQLTCGSHALTATAANDPVRLMALIHHIREQRWSSAIEEAVPGVASVSCAVSNPQNKESIAFCLTFPASMASDAEINALAQQLCQAANLIGRKYGDPYWLG